MVSANCTISRRIPWEMRNRWRDPACHEVIVDLERRYLDWLVTTSRPVTAHCSGLCRLFSAEAREEYHCWIEPDGRVGPEALRQAPERTYV